MASMCPSSMQSVAGSRRAQHKHEHKTERFHKGQCIHRHAGQCLNVEPRLSKPLDGLRAPNSRRAQAGSPPTHRFNFQNFSQMSGAPQRTPPRGVPARGGAPGGAGGKPNAGVQRAAPPPNKSFFKRCCPNGALPNEGKQTAVGCCIIGYAIFCFVAAFTRVRVPLIALASRTFHAASARMSDNCASRSRSRARSPRGGTRCDTAPT